VQRQACLADPAGPGQCDQPAPFDRLGDPIRVVGPSDELGELMWKVARRAGGPGVLDGVIVAEDGRFQLTELRRGVKAELLSQRFPIAAF
jgi:hypothetical protein